MKDQEEWARALRRRRGGSSALMPDLAPAGAPRQLNLDDLGRPLSHTTFVVVDLETTGTGRDAEITEIGAVKVMGGEVQGEFSTLVNPRRSVITPFVSSLTGITNSMVADAPTLASVLPSFLEFAHGAVLVAHNAPFDIGFLRRACQELDYRWPRPVVIDTVKVARATLSREEVRNHRLGTLASFFNTATTPNHRALDDARATVDVLHGLISRLGTHGVFSLEELRGLTTSVTAGQRRKSFLADDLPEGPGVYSFLDASGRVLYIGTSGNIKKRVRSYFTAAETRTRMGEMVGLAERVQPVECATRLEAGVRELRMIAEHKPPYNRRSKNTERLPWLVFTAEDYPRLSLVHRPPDEAVRGIALGPLPSARSAKAAKNVLENLYPIRRCNDRIRAGSIDSHVPCPAGELGKCGGPCAGDPDVGAYEKVVDSVRQVFAGNCMDLWDLAKARMAALASHERYEEAADFRDGALTLTRGVRRAGEHRLFAWSRRLVAATPSELPGGWDIAVIKNGRLCAAGRCLPGQSPRQVAAALELTAEHPTVGAEGALAADPAETALLAGWLFDGRTRLMDSDVPWAVDRRAGAAG